MNLPASWRETVVVHETVEAFKSVGFPLNRTLESMLNEDPEHQRPRRGSGYTQSGRFLADLINQPRSLSSACDLRVFSDIGTALFKNIIATCRFHLDKVPSGISELIFALDSIPEKNSQIENYILQLGDLENLPNILELEESRLLANLILSLLGKNMAPTDTVVLPSLAEKLEIGTCPEAERYFLEFIPEVKNILGPKAEKFLKDHGYAEPVYKK